MAAGHGGRGTGAVPLAPPAPIATICPRHHKHHRPPKDLPILEHASGGRVRRGAAASKRPPPPAPKSSRALDRLFGSSAAMATARAPLRCQPTPRLTRASVRRGLDRHLDGHAPAGASTDQICSALLLLVPWLSRATYARTRAVNKKTASYMDMSPKNEHESKE